MKQIFINTNVSQFYVSVTDGRNTITRLIRNGYAVICSRPQTIKITITPVGSFSPSSISRYVNVENDLSLNFSFNSLSSEPTQRIYLRDANYNFPIANANLLFIDENDG